MTPKVPPRPTWKQTLLRIAAAPEVHELVLAMAELAVNAPRPPAPPPRLLTMPSVLWRGLDHAVAYLLEDWWPQHRPNEKPYNDQLQAFVERHAPGATVERGAQHNGIPDLKITWPGWFFGDSVIVELKTHLRLKTECDRLVGQVLGYHTGGHKVLVVLTGDTTKTLVETIRSRLKPHAPLFSDDGSILVVDRTTTGMAAAKQRRLYEAAINEKALEALRDSLADRRRLRKPTTSTPNTASACEATPVQ